MLSHRELAEEEDGSAQGETVSRERVLWKPAPPGKGLTHIHRNASQLDSCRHCVPTASLHKEQLGSWALGGKEEDLRAMQWPHAHVW